jgi:hypothetical protein
MVKDLEMITVQLDPESELAKVLDAAETTPVVLVSNGDRYVVSRQPVEPADDYDPEEFRAALRAAAGTFTPEEGERLKQDIYRWREEGTRPINRP